MNARLRCQNNRETHENEADKGTEEINPPDPTVRLIRYNVTKPGKMNAIDSQVNRGETSFTIGTPSRDFVAHSNDTTVEWKPLFQECHRRWSDTSAAIDSSAWNSSNDPWTENCLVDDGIGHPFIETFGADGEEGTRSGYA